MQSLMILLFIIPYFVTLFAAMLQTSSKVILDNSFRIFLVGPFRRKAHTIVVTFFKTNEVTDFITFISWLELTLNATLLGT